MYAAILREIEVGQLSWGDNFHYVETEVLGNPKKSSGYFPKKSSSAEDKHKMAENESEDKAWFCSNFQRNKCAHKSSHTSVVKGKMRLCQHICASCYQKDRVKLAHPECSSACPHAGAMAGVRV